MIWVVCDSCSTPGSISCSLPTSPWARFMIIQLARSLTVELTPPAGDWASGSRTYNGSNVFSPDRKCNVALFSRAVKSA